MSLLTPTIKGDLIPEKRSGHVSVFYKGLFIVFGGYYDKDGVEGEEEIDDYFPSNNIWFYNVETSTWKNIVTKGDSPGKIVGSCACVVADKLYLFGGFHKENAHTNKLFSLDMGTLTWCDHSEEVEGLQPSPRDKFGCWKWRQNIIIFGGFGSPPIHSRTIGDFFADHDDGVGWNNQLYVLDCSGKLKWSQPNCTGDTPCPRAAFAHTQIGKLGYLSGGRFQHERRDDMYSIDLENYLWTHIKMPKVSPPGRSWHVMAPVSDHHFFIYGGIDNDGETLDDVWVYNIKDNMWTELERATKNLGRYSMRLWHTICNTDYEGEVIIFGGCSSSNFLNVDCSVHTNIVSVFRFSPLPLRRLCVEKITSSGLGK